MQGQGGSDCWITAFKLQTSFDGKSWLDYGRTDAREAIIFPGNTDDEAVLEHTLPHPVFARFIRICVKSSFAGLNPSLRTHDQFPQVCASSSVPVLWVSPPACLWSVPPALPMSFLISNHPHPSPIHATTWASCQDGALKPAALSCSSQRNATLGAACGRLGHASAWQARDNDPEQFLEVDIGEPALLSGVLLQVRFH